jgi:phenylalanyl-tRNA synthetase beta chain
MLAYLFHFSFIVKFELNRLTDMIRHAVVECGFIEALTFTLCSCADVADKFGKNIQDIPAVHIANPKSLDFQVRCQSNTTVH